MTPWGRTYAPAGATVLSWVAAIVVSFLALDGYLAQAHLRGADAGALHTVVLVFAVAQGGMFFIAIQMVAQALLNSSAERRVWKREARGAASALVGVLVFLAVLVGLPRLLLG